MFVSFKTDLLGIQNMMSEGVLLGWDYFVSKYLFFLLLLLQKVIERVHIC